MVTIDALFVAKQLLAGLLVNVKNQDKACGQAPAALSL